MGYSPPNVTAKRKGVFLRELARVGVITDAAKSCGVDRKTIYIWRDSDTEFAKALNAALEESVDALEREARRRALKSSDVLLIFLMKGNNPEKYRDRYDVNQRIEARHELAHRAEDMTDDQLAAIAATALQPASPPLMIEAHLDEEKDKVSK